MSGPTPGPWFRDCTTVFALSEDGVNRFSASVQGGWVVTGRQRTAVEELEATARLFAAAPTQHEELVRFLPIIERAESDPELWARLTEGTGIATANGYRAAIAKAAGAQP